MMKRILLVDDEPNIVKLVAARLKANGYEVISAYDGQEALETARRVKPDLIILDLMLPKMSGYKVCGLLKGDSRFAKIPIIIFTARAQEEDVKLGGELGAEAYVTKPFDSKMLLSKIKELLKQP
ncbi:MAG: response regulator [Candidatus Omnitrophica bacterium]|nr:response regulator [Candidatus Omnitrophota bacterium]MBU0896654.1 response regulator [Candidatus Omnitrophota bacterium]MBU1133534.1 response regulator [Candidatus Omnitrophota bacterium]MBU1366688.1 response regulator [Candidatus Omnitrophota bacterium]MBU1524495.1 response regulator [Candidatus Omnitrophota bacterium]